MNNWWDDTMATIGELRARRLWLRLQCEGCHRTTLLPSAMLPVRLSDELPVNLAAAHFRCRQCGSKELTSAMEDALAARPQASG